MGEQARTYAPTCAYTYANSRTRAHDARTYACMHACTQREKAREKETRLCRDHQQAQNMLRCRHMHQQSDLLVGKCCDSGMMSRLVCRGHSCIVRRDKQYSS